MAADIEAHGVFQNGEVRIEITNHRDTVDTGGNTGGHSDTSGVDNSRSLVLYNGQMGYWQTRTTAGAEHDHTYKEFVPVGPSEADKQAAANRLALEKQQAETAAKDFAAKTATAAAAAEQQRQAAVNAAIAAGQFQSVALAQNNLNGATQEASSLKSVADNALSKVVSKRQAATNAAVAAVQAETAYQNLLQDINKKGAGKNLIDHNGMLGYEQKEIHETANHSYLGTSFISIGISVAQRNNAQADAVNKRKTANQLSAEVSTAEQESLAASKNYNNAEIRRQAAAAALNAAQEAAKKAAEAERQRQMAEAAAAAAAEQKRLADEAEKAAEMVRIAAEQEKARQAREAAANRLKSTDVQSVRGIPVSVPASVSPLSWSVASVGGISLGEDVAGAVWSRISAALAELRGIMTASMAGPVAVTVAGLLYSHDVGVGSDIVPGRDISNLMPGDALSLPDTATLNLAADGKTGVSMPVRGRVISRADGSLDTQLVRTPVAGVVPVIRAVLDQATGYWGCALPAMAGVPGQSILVSPSDAPGMDAPLGLGGPVPLPEHIVHTGDQDTVPQGVKTTTTPVLGPVDFRDFILIFPAESGLQPLYVMQNSPYGEATDKGKYSGRPYNPDKAGGPVQELDWHGAVIDQAGIDKVKLHTGRFEPSDANQVMIDRLEKILSGQLQVTDTDKRFYTHEMRELERYRALGVPDGVEDKSVWNDAHTATLEDYKINEKNDSLYTPEAIKAYEEQEMGDLK